MRRHLFCLIAVLLIGVAGCASTPSATGSEAGTLELKLTKAGDIVVDGRTTSPERLVKRLRAAGATPDTPIIIEIAADVPVSNVSNLASRLASAGYRKIMFKRPKHAEASAAGTAPARTGR